MKKPMKMPKQEMAIEKREDKLAKGLPPKGRKDFVKVQKSERKLERKEK